MAKLNPENLLDKILLYWQTEDLLRAYQLDASKLLSSDSFKEEFASDEAKNWLQELAKSMAKEGVEKSGHSSSSLAIIRDLKAKHDSFIRNETYKAQVEVIKPALENLQTKREEVDHLVYGMCELIYAFYLQKMTGNKLSDGVESLGQETIKCVQMLLEA